MNIKNNKTTYISIVLATTLLVGCGSSSSGPSKNSGTGNIDLANYFPSKNISKTYTTVDGNTTDFTPSTYSETINIEETSGIKTITITDDDGEDSKYIITDKNITHIYDDFNFTSYRHVNLGDTFIKKQNTDVEKIKEGTLDYATITNKVDLECIIDEQLKEFKKGDEHKYTGDILKIKCINNGKVTIDVNPNLIALSPEAFKDINGTHDNYDIFDFYLKKDIGDVASIDDSCVVVNKDPKFVDDRKNECVEKTHEYEYYIEPAK